MLTMEETVAVAENKRGIFWPQNTKFEGLKV